MKQDDKPCGICRRTGHGACYEAAVELAADKAEEIRALRAEVARLRAALDEIEDGACYTPSYATNCDGKCKELARAALATTSDLNTEEP